MQGATSCKNGEFPDFHKIGSLYIKDKFFKDGKPNLFNSGKYKFGKVICESPLADKDRLGCYPSNAEEKMQEIMSARGTCTSKSGWTDAKCIQKCSDSADCHTKCGKKCISDCACNAGDVLSVGLQLPKSCFSLRVVNTTAKFTEGLSYEIACSCWKHTYCVQFTPSSNGTAFDVKCATTKRMAFLEATITSKKEARSLGLCDATIKSCASPDSSKLCCKSGSILTPLPDTHEFVKFSRMTDLCGEAAIFG